MSTDNIGLAQLRSGLDLIRVGKPLQAELAAWRYGNEFARRRRRYLALAVSGAVVAIASTLGVALPVKVVGAGALSLTGAAMSVRGFADMWRHWADGSLQRLLIRDDTGNLLPVTKSNMRGTALIPTGPSVGWELRLPCRSLWPANRFLKSIGIRNTTIPAPRDAVLTGGSAQRALASILPHLNGDGGSAKRVRDAVDVIAESRDIDHLLRKAAVNTEARKTHFKIKDGESNVGALPGRFRLALEMALHEDHESRAMEGELRELEDRWRDAETIAAIADSLLTAPDIEVAIARLQNRPNVRASRTSPS